MSTVYAAGQLLNARWNQIAVGSTRPIYQGREQAWVTDVAPSSLGGPNLVSNPSATVDTTGWSAVGAGAITRNTTTYYDAPAGFRITSTNANDGAKFALPYLMPFTTYEFGAWISRDGTTSVDLTMTDGTIVSTKSVTLDGYLWTYVTGTVRTGTTLGTWDIRATTPTAASSFFIDQVTVRRVMDAVVPLAHPEIFAWDGQDWSRSVRQSLRKLDSVATIGTGINAQSPNYQRTYFNDQFNIPANSGVRIKQRIWQKSGGTGSPSGFIKLIVNGLTSVSFGYGSPAITSEASISVEIGIAPRDMILMNLTSTSNVLSVWFESIEIATGSTSVYVTNGNSSAMYNGWPMVINSIELQNQPNGSTATFLHDVGPTQVYEVVGQN